ncbi:MAG: response regulator [Candidatus Latescibacterota bacterium]|nr:response regulator [Candidatus Latescibacterota bacterium]MEE2627395.1 response regulator [Candidatus Latescibacterota bacterium]MEE2725558.1 response regulator [Candidatus Latescibacterota bacterium]
MNDKPTWTLLLTDPNRMARTTLTRQLTYYGYAVHEADSGRQAVGIVQKQPSAIDLILLDTSIADVPYTNVIQVLQKVQSSAAIILTTEQTITDGRSIPEGVTAVLKKPMRTDRMLSVVAKALGRT